MTHRHQTSETFAADLAETSVSFETDTTTLEQYLPDVAVDRDEGVNSAARAPSSSLRSARLVALDGRRGTIVWRGHSDRIDADVASDVDVALLEFALANGDAVFVEGSDHDKPLIVGVMQTRLAREVHITANKIVLDAAQEVVIRAGRAAIRLREDGDMELVGSRISAASRGLFRLVGRILRLN